MAKKQRSFVLEKRLDHIAFIMDGNGRWAKLRGLPRHLGHKKACEMLHGVIDACVEFKIRNISFYAFSTENWNRPQEEIDHLMDYLEEFFRREIGYLMEIKARVIVSGELSRIPEHTRNVCYDAIERTKDNPDFTINICLNYGGRAEITRAARLIAEEAKQGKIEIEKIDEAYFASKLYTSGLPDIDLMVRTSGEQRLSNYLLWQNAYAEFVFTPVKWPDFDREALIRCLEEYQTRNRRFGGIKNG